LPALRSIAGLENVDPGSAVYIADNPLLDDLSAFSGKTLFGSVILTKNKSLASLDGLEMLSVMQSFEISSSPQLSSLAALGLYYVHGDVVIQDLDQIVDLTGLEALSHVGTLTIWANASLTNILALAKLREITELAVRENPALTSLAGHSFAETSLKSVDIGGNSSLSDLKGFEQVTEMGYLRVEGSKTLGSLDGLASLVTVGDNGLYLDNDDALTSLAGLRALARVDGDISVEDNAVLQDVGVLESITFAGSSLTIMHNPSLPSCQARRVYEAQVAKGWKGEARICKNLEDGCEGTTDCTYLD
jgi:internalin A